MATLLSAPQSYQLHITVAHDTTVTVGKLGACTFPAGRYVYTGSARRNLEARIRRHLSSAKRLHWHIDYLLASPNVRIENVDRSSVEECALNQQVAGSIPLSRFGASDCRNGCGSHLKLVDSD